MPVVIGGVVALGEGSCYFPSDSSKFLTEEIWMLEISMFPVNSPKMGFFCPRLCILDEICPRGRKFSDKTKFRGGDNCSFRSTDTTS